MRTLAMARLFCSSANIYIMDDPFHHLHPETKRIVEEILREKQSNGVMIIMSVRSIDYVDPEDRILILDEGVSVEYGKYKDLSVNPNSRITKFLKNREAQDKEEEKK